MHQTFGTRTPPGPARELTALHRLPSWIKGEVRRCRGRKRERGRERKRGREEEGKRDEGKGKDPDSQYLKCVDIPGFWY